MPAATWGHSSHARFLSSAMPMTLQHFVHEPQDFPGTMAGFEAAFQSSPKNSDAAGAGALARSDLLRFASPILIVPTLEMSIELLHRPGTNILGRRLGKLEATPQPGAKGRAFARQDDFVSGNDPADRHVA